MSSKWTSRELTDRLFSSADPAPFGRRRSRLVFVARNLARERVSALFQSFRT
jgi:hypothetical protein